MKKSTWFLMGMAALLLSFGLVLAGCDDSDSGGSGGGGNLIIKITGLTPGATYVVGPMWEGDMNGMPFWSASGCHNKSAAVDAKSRI